MHQRRRPWFIAGTVAAVLALSPTYSPASDDKVEQASPTGVLELAPIPTGNVVLYLATGLRSSNSVDASIAVHCTSYVSDGTPSPYPFDITIEFYDFQSTLKGTATLTMTAPMQTKNAVTVNTFIYDEDVVLGITLDPGSLRIHAPKKRAAGILCSADMTSKTDPPAYQRTVPLTRVAKFKPPKPTF